MNAFSIAALAVMVLAHIVRAVRQAMLFPACTRPGNFHLSVGLSIGYVINALLPFRIGEPVRALYVAARAGVPFATICASVIAERLSDLVVVGALLAIVSLTHDATLATPAIAMILAAIGIVVVARLVQTSSRARALSWSAASLLNARLRLTLIDTMWTSAQLIGSVALLRPRYLLLSLLMWSAYLAAYALLGRATGVDVTGVVAMLLGSPLTALFDTQAIAGQVVLVTALAALAIILAGLAADGVGLRDGLRAMLHLGLPRAELALALPGHAFARSADYGLILGAHFTNRESTIARFGLQGLGGARVRHLLPGGSDAITAVIETPCGPAIRKFAEGDAAAKLADQAHWLDANGEALPLAAVTARHRGGGVFHYDMPYLDSARDLYEMAHVMPFADSRTLLADVTDRIARWHDAQAMTACADTAVHAYVADKIVANACIALTFARTQLPEQYRINGVAHALGEWDRLLDADWCAAQIADRRTGIIHGDLTIENIVVCPEADRGWYLIDPNPGNRFDTPLIDWAKLMQSLNLGYETLSRGPAPQVRDGAIDVMLHRSQVYSHLHAALREQLADHLTVGQFREIAFHEIVNYLRLIPYKIRRDPAKAMTFFASASLLLRRYDENTDG